MQNNPFEHGGNLRKILNFSEDENPDSYLDFSANINPLGIPDEIRYMIYNDLYELEKYPDPHSSEFIKNAADFFNVNSSSIYASNGASDVFFKLMKAVLKPEVLLLIPSYSDYEKSALLADRKIRFISLEEENDFNPDWNKIEIELNGNEIFILGRPNNPTGKDVDFDIVLHLIKKNPKTFFVIDEAFYDFMDSQKKRFSSIILPNLLTVVSLTKIYAIPGLRAALSTGPEDLIRNLQNQDSSWPLNYLAQKASEIALNTSGFIEKTREFIKKEKSNITEKLSTIKDLKIYPSDANFFLIKVSKDIADSLYDYLINQKIILRRCDNFRNLNKSFFRFGISKKENNDILIEALFSFFKPESGPKKKIKKTPALMIQGTGSNVGKSLLTAALCRIFLNEGYRVIPFKAQNMSLNSCVTIDGKEMSRAQHLQALAAMVEPDIRMNPVLLKPVENSLSQIILLGKPQGNMGYKDYRQKKDEIWKTISSAYDELAETADLMIIEGAGSPVEMNLKSNDVVNMKMAEFSDASVILTGNIDFGGIFASFLGTLLLLNKEEKKRVIGLFVNQFRGDESLFEEGKSLLEKITGKPVLGTIPYVSKHMLPDEDSLAFDFKIQREESIAGTNPEIEIHVVRYPHISNFTDFDPFFIHNDILIKFIEKPLNHSPDVLILPGSKNVIGDMQWLDSSGFSAYIQKLSEANKTEIIGICGGFQLLGKVIEDPYGIEQNIKEKNGLGLLSIATSLEQDKVLKRFHGSHIESGCDIKGYEIHHGQTRILGNEGNSPESIFKNINDTGYSINSKMVWGSYIHGLFDNDAFRLWFLNQIRQRKGISPAEKIPSYDIENAIENFASIVKEKINLEAIKKDLGLF